MHVDGSFMLNRTGAAGVEHDAFPFSFVRRGFWQVVVGQTNVTERAGPSGDGQVAFAFLMMMLRDIHRNLLSGLCSITDYTSLLGRVHIKLLQFETKNNRFESILPVIETPGSNKGERVSPTPVTIYPRINIWQIQLEGFIYASGPREINLDSDYDQCHTDKRQLFKKVICVSRMMIQPKMKENCQPQPSDSKKSLSPAHAKTRVKNCREGGTKGSKIQKDMPVIPIKRRTNQPSKSFIQTQENKHYNSPNSAIPSQPESRAIHQFTFTQLLNQSRQISQPRLPHIIDPDFQPLATYISDPSLKINESMMRKTPLTGHGLTHTNPSFSRKGEERLADTDFSKQSGLNNQEISCEDRKSENGSNSPTQLSKSSKKLSKSPIRMTNAHKLNNTPKLKDRQKKTNKHQNISSKTFTSILNSQELPLSCTHHAKQDSINLLCSEKIFKFREINPVRRQKETSPKHKSNLQSTGIINLSQPLEGSQPSHYYPYSQFTKETSNHRVQIDRIISESNNIKQFQEQEQNPPFNGDFFPKIEELKMRVSEVSSYLKNQLQFYNEASFSEDICSNFNPELKHYDISGPISQLTQLSAKIQSIFQDLIEKIRRASFIFEERIRDDIKTIQQSQVSLINWTEVERELKERQFLEGQLCKNEIMSLRLQTLGLQLRDGNITEDFFQPNLKLTEASTELNSIKRQLAQQIQKIFFFNQTQTSNSSNSCLGRPQVHIFRSKAIQLQNLQQCIDELLAL